jgi:alkylation response protein AidB-like acyl-CoA dehydrogenase
MFAPQSHGGLELNLPMALEVISALGRIDGSVGWTAMIGSGSHIFAPMLPRETYERVYQNGPDVIIAGSIQPAGTAEAALGGWRVNGRWPFASGCQHADWVFGLCVMTAGGKPLPGEAFHQVQAASHWRHALAGTLKDEALLTQGTQTGIWVATTCVRAADARFALAGGSAVYKSSPPQRRMRDLHAAAQHASVHQRHYAAAGKTALAQHSRQFEDSRRLAAE